MLDYPFLPELAQKMRAFHIDEIKPTNEICYIMEGFHFFCQDNGFANARIQYQWDSIARCVGVILQREISNRRVFCYIIE